MRPVERMVIRLVSALYVLSWLAVVGAPEQVEHIEAKDGDEDLFAPLRESSGAAS